METCNIGDFFSVYRKILKNNNNSNIRTAANYAGKRWIYFIYLFFKKGKSSEGIPGISSSPAGAKCHSTKGFHINCSENIPSEVAQRPRLPVGPMVSSSVYISVALVGSTEIWQVEEL